MLNKREQILVRKLNAIILTEADLPTMGLDNSSTSAIGGMAKQPPIVDGFKQSCTLAHFPTLYLTRTEFFYLTPSTSAS